MLLCTNRDKKKSSSASSMAASGQVGRFKNGMLILSPKEIQKIKKGPKWGKEVRLRELFAWKEHTLGSENNVTGLVSYLKFERLCLQVGGEIWNLSEEEVEFSNSALYSSTRSQTS